MGFTHVRHALAAIGFITASMGASAGTTFTSMTGAVQQTSYATLAGNGFGVNMDSLTCPGGASITDVPCSTDNLVHFGSANFKVHFGERFDGQTLGTDASGKFDTLSLQPSSMQLLAGAPDHNLAFFSAGTVTVSGLGPLTEPEAFDFEGRRIPPDETLGEGAVSVLFDGNQSSFGLFVNGAGGNNLGDLIVAFFDQNGKLIDQITLSTTADPAAAGAANAVASGIGYAFKRDGGQFDIAGVSIWNTIAGGVSYSGFAYDSERARVPGHPAPEPGALLLAGLGLLTAGASLRRRARA